MAEPLSNQQLGANIGDEEEKNMQSEIEIREIGK